MSNQERTKALRVPGTIHTITGRSVDLLRFSAADVDLYDIAWGLGRILRYNGHIRKDHTVAHHSIIMSYMVPDEYKMEALLHDAAEAYIGDIIWPVKALFPDIEEFENRINWHIMSALGPDAPGSTPSFGLYKKSEPIAEADAALLAHESFDFGRAGYFDKPTEEAWLEAGAAHEDYWYAPMYAFVQRFNQLTSDDPSVVPELDLDLMTKIYFYDQWLAEKRGEKAEEEVSELDKEEMIAIITGNVEPMEDVEQS
jgi:hypothetical protein